MTGQLKEPLNNELYEAFWRKLEQSKFDLIYYQVHFNHCTTVSRIFKYTIIGATSLATGAWISWNSIPSIGITCAITIWLLQGISAISELFPYESRKQELREMLTELEPLYLKMENDWRSIRSLAITNQEIQSKLQQYNERQADIKRHYFKDDSLPEIEKFRTKADEKTEEYFRYFI